MTIISSFHYDHRNRKATLLALPDGTEIKLHVFYVGTYKDLRKFDICNVPCLLKFRKPELAAFAASAMGATRVGTVVFAQSSVSELGISWPISDEIFFRKTFDSWNDLQTTVDSNGTMWTEVRTIGAASRQLKYNIIHNPRSTMPASLYDMFITDDATFIRAKSAKDYDSISPSPYVFTRAALKHINLYFSYEEGNWSAEIQSYLTQSE